MITIPCCFAPIVLRYTVIEKRSTKFRMIANGLLPVGSALTLVLIDSLFHSWSLNVIVVVMIALAAYFRGVIAKKDNSLRK